MNHFNVGPYIIVITLISTSLNRQPLYPMIYGKAHCRSVNEVLEQLHTSCLFALCVQCFRYTHFHTCSCFLFSI